MIRARSSSRRCCCILGPAHRYCMHDWCACLMASACLQLAGRGILCVRLARRRYLVDVTRWLLLPERALLVGPRVRGCI